MIIEKKPPFLVSYDIEIYFIFRTGNPQHSSCHEKMLGSFDSGERKPGGKVNFINILFFLRIKWKTLLRMNILMNMETLPLGFLGISKNY